MTYDICNVCGKMAVKLYHIWIPTKRPGVYASKTNGLCIMCVYSIATEKNFEITYDNKDEITLRIKNK